MALSVDDSVVGKVLAIDITGVDPLMDEFSVKEFDFVFWTNDRLSIDREGY